MSSIIISTIKQPSQDVNTTSFLSQIQPINKKPEVYLTYEDIQRRNHLRFKRFTYAFISCLVFFSMLYSLVVMKGHRLYFLQTAGCKITYFVNFYVTVFSNLVMLFLFYRKYTVYLKDKTNTPALHLKNPRVIMSTLGIMVAIAFAFYNLTRCSCNANMHLQAGLTFLLQLVQIAVMGVFNFIYYYRIFKEIEISIALDDESVDKNKTCEKKEEQFNGSFALNLSNIGKNREALKYKRRCRNRGSAKKESTIDISIKDLDDLEVVKKPDEEIKSQVLAKKPGYSTPTKKLSNQFKQISVHDDNDDADN